MNNELMFSSVSNEWQTPIELFKLLDKEFSFTLDPCSTEENHLCDKYYTIETDGLNKEWRGENVFMNPPYGREIIKWMKKAYDSTRFNDTKVICLVPSRTDTKWFHQYAINGDIRFIRGRLKFINRALPSFREDGQFKITAAPFPSMIVIFDGSYCYNHDAPMKEKFQYYENLA